MSHVPAPHRGHRPIHLLLLHWLINLMLLHCLPCLECLLLLLHCLPCHCLPCLECTPHLLGGGLPILPLWSIPVVLLLLLLLLLLLPQPLRGDARRHTAAFALKLLRGVARAAGAALCRRLWNTDAPLCPPAGCVLLNGICQAGRRRRRRRLCVLQQVSDSQRDRACVRWLPLSVPQCSNSRLRHPCLRWLSVPQCGCSV
jgi:hypothetical protein